MNAQNLLPGKILEQIYYAHVYSHLTYGLAIWGSMLLKTTEKIRKIQHDCINIINKRHKVQGTQSSLPTTILPMEELIKQELIKLGYKISNNLLP